jgi:hypothetical protein
MVRHNNRRNSRTKLLQRKREQLILYLSSFANYLLFLHAVGFRWLKQDKENQEHG